jgi:hypothetical protein
MDGDNQWSRNMKIKARRSDSRKRVQVEDVVDLTRPTLEEYSKAAADLRRAEKILRGSPNLLAGVAEECARWLPRFADELSVRNALVSAAWCSRPHAFCIGELDRVAREAIERGKKRPFLTRAELKLRNAELRAKVRAKARR